MISNISKYNLIETWHNLTSLWRNISKLFGKVQIPLEEAIEQKYLNSKVSDKIKKLGNTSIIFNKSNDVMVTSFITKHGTICHLESGAILINYIYFIVLLKTRV